MLLRNRGLSKDFILTERKENYSPPPEDSFFFRVFDKNLDTAKCVLHSNYLEAMKKGVLPPDNYGQLTVLDSYYCYRGADSYNTALCAINKDKEPELYDLMSELHKSYREYNVTFFVGWHIRTSESINATKNFIKYAEHEHHVACSIPPIYTLVAMLPCYYLWYWFSDEMLKEMPKDNLYYLWATYCHSANSAYRIGNFIEEWKRQGKEFDETLATNIYTTSMHCELDIFNEALTNQTNGGITNGK